ncbi:RloB family protein [Pedobacter nototheniae]|uniref:RloB family protein n=1 Tax=Pedobacter nototheniae TaxID=2488994 RepID=UPI00103E96D1|nr:RloB family protein [Pedobacter nototheniae]
MQYLSRKRIYQKQDPAKDAKKIYIFCEGAVREVAYLKYFKGLSSNIDIVPIPPFEDKSDPEKLKQYASLLFFGDNENGVLPTYKISKEFKDEIWFVIDTDLWEEHGKIDILRDFCSVQNSKHYCWQVAQSNPCFEIWLLYHLQAAKPTEDQVNKASSFKEYVASCVSGGVDVRKIPIHLEAAIKNSLTNFDLDKENKVGLFSTEMHNLGAIILSFVGEQLIKAEKMMVEAQPKQ